MRDIPEDIHARVPVNKSSSITGGFHYNPNLPESTEICSENPIPCNPLPENAKDLRNSIYGRFTVIGFHSIRKGTYKGKPLSGQQYMNWVVRCQCGNYSISKGKAIIDNKNKDECCKKCRHLKTLKYRDQNGVNR